MISDKELNSRIFSLAQDVLYGNPDKAYANGYRDAIKDVFEIIGELQEKEFHHRNEESLQAIYDALEEDGYY